MSSIPTDNRVQLRSLTPWLPAGDPCRRSTPFPERAPSLEEAQQYCSRLAHSHYENFSVVTWFLPKHLHQHFYNVYAYCRISDDLGDEVGDTQQSLALLDAWEAELNATYLSLVEPPDVRTEEQILESVLVPPNPNRPAIRSSWRCARPFASSTFRASRSPTCSPRFVRTRRSRATPRSTTCSATARTRPIPWDISCCICADIVTRSGSNFPITPAPRCSWRISGRMLRSTTTRAASICRWRAWRSSASARATSPSAGRRRSSSR